MRHLTSTRVGTVHRPTREERRTREFQELRRENHHLSREIARLRKHLEKATDTKEAFESEDETPPPQRRADPAPGIGTHCPKCPREESPPMRVVQVPFGVLLVCPDCKYRFVQRS